MNITKISSFTSPQETIFGIEWKIFPEMKPKLKKSKTRLADITAVQNEADKEAFARKMNLGFIDIFSSIRRKTDSTKDGDLIPVEDIVTTGRLDKILNNHLSIDRICCTYKLAFETLISNLDKSKLTFSPNELAANQQKVEYAFNSKKVEIYLLYPATRSGQKGEVKDVQYKKLLFRM